jgi:putative radical SAM enzyme (TIGR03279 family)
MLIIKNVYPNSLASEIGLAPGDKIIKINHREVNDEIDFQFQTADDQLRLEISRKNGKTEIWEIEKTPGESFGVEFEPITYRRCQNKCIFCFVDQMPPNLRPELYVKDDDFRLSFLYGNYLTLTNFSDDDFERIRRQRLSPIFVSVHTTDPDLRREMCRHRNAGDILKQLKRLAAMNIELHIQIVLCPEINDGEYLKKTVHDLASLYPQIQSIAIVPVGLTKWREEKGLYPLKPITREYARNLIPTLEEWQRNFRENWGINFVYLADEFYLTAELPIPDEGYYDGFGQLEDGVGMVRLFLDDFENAQQHFPEKIEQKKEVTIVTSELSSTFMPEVIRRLNRIENLEVQMVVAENQLFGESVTVTGLLSGQDILNALDGKDLGELVVLPPNVLNADNLFLDNMKISDLEKNLDVEIVIPDYDLYEFYEKIF